MGRGRVTKTSHRIKDGKKPSGVQPQQGGGFGDFLPEEDVLQVALVNTTTILQQQTAGTDVTIDNLQVFVDGKHIGDIPFQLREQFQYRTHGYIVDVENGIIAVY